tara:strand:- start:2141 stop:2320 length:180 start_codon:yes stop_codon:yes gene_type:complete
MCSCKDPQYIYSSNRKIRTCSDCEIKEEMQMLQKWNIVDKIEETDSSEEKPLNETKDKE